jgi:coatomer protein complex subunit epsilon
MDSSELYHIKQQFILGAYKTLIKTPLPSPTSPDYTPTVLYQSRAHIALSDPASALKLIGDAPTNVALKAASSLARFVAKEQSTGGEKDEGALEELRDLCVEIEGDDVEGGDRDKETVKIVAGTAFARAGEVEEALETLGGTQNLEAVALTVQIYLSIHRPDLARREYDRAKSWAEDDLLLQLIESTIGLVTGKDSYSNSSSFYTEQLGNPSLTSTHLLTARGVTRILRGEINEAKSDLEEALGQDAKDGGETLAAMVVASGLGGGAKKAEGEELWSRLKQEYPQHPLVVDLTKKEAEFDEALAKFTVPPAVVVG